MELTDRTVRTVGQIPTVLNELTSSDGRVTWQARRSEDRGRLQVVAIVQPSETPTVVEALTDAQLRALLAETSPAPTTAWLCVECGTPNDRARRWCRVCSSHESGAR